MTRGDEKAPGQSSEFKAMLDNTVVYCLHMYKVKGRLGYSSVTKHSPSMHETLSSIPGTKKHLKNSIYIIDLYVNQYT